MPVGGESTLGATWAQPTTASALFWRSSPPRAERPEAGRRSVRQGVGRGCRAALVDALQRGAKWLSRTQQRDRDVRSREASAGRRAVRGLCVASEWHAQGARNSLDRPPATQSSSEAAGAAVSAPVKREGPGCRPAFRAQTKIKNSTHSLARRRRNPRARRSPRASPPPSAPVAPIAVARDGVHESSSDLRGPRPR
jgi:hypothetical protein